MQAEIIGIRPAERPSFPSHLQYTGQGNFLSPPEVKSIIDYMEATELKPGTVGNGGTPNDGQHAEEVRSVENAAVPTKGFEWLYKRVVDRVKWANDEHYRFTLSGLCEPIGFLKYTPSSEEKPEPGHYNWHQDFGGGQFSSRKLSLVIQLSNADEYEGCELKLCTEGEWVAPYKAAGDAILFPSWTPHCVTNIESGVRRALVVWVHGPQFQ